MKTGTPYMPFVIFFLGVLCSYPFFVIMLRSAHPIDLWEVLVFVLIVMAFYAFLRRYILPMPQAPTYILCGTPVFGPDPMNESVQVQLYTLSPYVSARAPVVASLASLDLGAAPSAAPTEPKKTV